MRHIFGLAFIVGLLHGSLGCSGGGSKEEFKPPKTVTIVGGGVIGSATAYYLKKLDKDVKVTVFETDKIASQASGKAGGFLAPDWDVDTPDVDKLSRMGFKMHKELAEEFGKEELGYRPCTSHSVEMDFTQKVGGPVPPEGGGINWFNTDGYASTKPKLIGDGVSSAQLYPNVLTNSLMDAAVAKGAEVVLKEVVGVNLNGDNSFKSVKLKDGTTYEADVVVMAMGPWLMKAKDWFPEASDLFKISAASGNIIILNATLPAEGVFLDYKSENTPEGHLEIYPRPADKVYSCGYFIREKNVVDPVNVNPSPQVISLLKEHLFKAAPSLKNSPVTTEWAAYLPLSEDFKPILGDIKGHPNSYIAGGHGWWGILHGPPSGLMMASKILGKTPPIDMEPYKMDRFSSLTYKIESIWASILGLE